MNASNATSPSSEQKKYKGVRQRKWGKWVSEIRVPGSQERLWLGSYSTAEAAAVAHDVASYCLKAGDGRLNFPLMLPAGVKDDMSPKSIQKVASDAGMGVDAQMILNRSAMSSSSSSDNERNTNETYYRHEVADSYQNWNGNQAGDSGLSISVDDYL